MSSDVEVDVSERLKVALHEAESKAWDSLGKYKFQMFGYWAAIWVHLNHVGGWRLPNPWKSLVKAARAHQEPNSYLRE